jgi:hypothetical protein
MYCVIKCVKSTRVLKGKFASSVFHSCKEKTPKSRILVSGPQCVKTTVDVTTLSNHTNTTHSSLLNQFWLNLGYVTNRPIMDIS